MSSSPKYTHAEPSAEYQEQERRRLQEEARRRAETAARQERLRFAEAKQEAERCVAALQTELAGVSAGPTGAFFAPDLLAELQRAAQAATTAASAAPTEKAARAATREMQQGLARLRRETTAASRRLARTNDLTATLERLEEELNQANLQGLLCCVPEPLAMRWPEQVKHVRGLLPAATDDEARKAEAALTALIEEVRPALRTATRLALEAERQRDRERQRQRIDSALADIESELATLRQEERSPRVAKDLRDVEQQSKTLCVFRREERLDEALSLAGQVGERLRRLTQEAAEFAAIAKSLSGLRTAVAAVQKGAPIALDARGAAELRQLLAGVETALRQGALREARQSVSMARERLEQHRRTSADELARRQADCDKAHDALALAAVMVAGLQQDPVVARWKASEVQALSKRLTQAEEALQAGRFAEVHRFAESAPAQIQALVASAQPLELQARLQQRMVDGVCQVMVEMGYRLQAPAAEPPGGPGAAIIVQAARESGELINVTVEHEGRIEYDVGGTLRKHEADIRTGAIRRTVRTCDEAESRLLELHGLLLELGIETDGLHWDGQPPERNTALPLPSSRPVAARPGRQLHGPKE